MSSKLTLLACTLLAVAFTVNAHGGGGGERGGRGDGPGPIGGGGKGGMFCDGGDSSSADSDDFDNGRRGKRSGGDGPGDFGGRCDCSSRLCRGVVGPLKLGCPNTNLYRECENSVCSPKTCLVGQVWNKTLGDCAGCPTGRHVAANLQVCVCDQGTTPDCVTGACVACPTNSNQTADQCTCAGATPVYDGIRKSCRACPVNATAVGGSCRCNSTQFWNRVAWACQDCPGVLQSPNTRYQKCVCNGTSQIFNRTIVSCYTCPAGTTAFNNKECRCPNYSYQRLNVETGVCECRRGLVPNPAGSGCVYPAVPVGTTTPSSVTTRLSP